jgi:hypothetical protein
MAERQTLTIYLHSSSEYINMPLAEAVQWLQSLLNEVPAEHRDNAHFSVELEYDYDGPTTLDFQVFYNRVETQEEADAREADDVKRKEDSKRYEIARLRSNLERLEREQR